LSDYIELRSSDNSLWIRIDRVSLEEAYQLCKKSGNLETGGVLIGRYSTNKTTCTVDKFLGPTEDSLQKAYTFESGIKGLKDIFSTFWKKKKYFIGDWHFHPGSSPVPSNQDYAQLREIACNTEFRCKCPVMIIIGERDNNYLLSCTVSIHGEEFIEFHE
jgi:proteasome lid subunit RPN8/RPN11